MPHTFFPAPGFLLGGTTPLREAFLMVGAAEETGINPNSQALTL